MTSRLLALASVILLGTTSMTAQPAPGWLRYPAISPDGKTIVFTYKGDLYRVPAAGGTATPLTAHAAHDFMPVWSRDGKQIAFASDRYGNFDIFVMPAEGGEARRLTYHSAAEYPYTFTPDDQGVVFGTARMDTAANRLFPTGSQPELYQVPAAGGRPVQLLTTPAEDVKFGRGGQLMLYHDKKGGENPWRKHHTSAIARDVWVYDVKAGTHRKLTSFAGEDRSPVFADGDRAFYYLSEESGSFNVHKMALEGGKPQQVTSFKKLPVRFLSLSDSGTLCFGYDGDLYTMRPGGSPQKVAVAIAADAKANRERVVPVTGGAREFAVAPSGKEVAFIARGDVFVASVEGGVTKRVTATPEEERAVGYSPDGKAIVYASERNGRWAIYEARKARGDEPYFYASTLIKEAPLVANVQQNTQPL
jgi:Tol biopolymer transport system component